MEVTIAEEVLTVVGFAEMTAANSSRFRKKVCAALNGHTVVEIDLSQTRFMDSAGLGALFAVHILTRRRNGVVRLVNPTPSVQQVLDLVGAGQIFEIVNTRSTDHSSSRARRLFAFELVHLLSRFRRNHGQPHTVGIPEKLTWGEPPHG